jgi:TPR repeat protein
VLTLAVALLIGVSLYAPDSRSDSFRPPPHDPTLGPFDPTTAQKLSPEKRREYDILFFNEMSVKDDHPTAQRYQLFREMAHDGFEVAHVTLELFDIRLAGDRFNPISWPRLKKLVAEGDVSAKCLYALYVKAFEPAVDESVRRQAIREAAEAGHPRCSTAHAGYLLLEGSEKEGFLWREQAASAGDLLAQLAQARAYASGKGAPRDLDRAECWLQEAWRSDQTAKTKSSIMAIQWGIREQRGHSSMPSAQYAPGTACKVRTNKEE